MPVKKKRAAHKKRKYTQKQKQKQSVNVKVSTSGGGSGGGTSFIPMPMNQAPQFDIGQLLQGLGAIRPPPIVPAPIAEAVREPVAEVIPRDELRAARMGPLHGSISAEPVRARKSKSVMGGPTESMFSTPSKAKSVSFVGGGSMPSESEGDVIIREPKSSQYYRGTGFIPEGSANKGKRTQYEEDIFGRSMAKTSDIRSSSSFEPIAMGGGKSNIRHANDYLFSPSAGDTSDTGARSAYNRGGMSFAN
jgi:hypothetical protein